MYRIAVLASGRGSNFAALAAACRSGAITAELVGVFCDRPGAGVLQRAAEFGVPAQLLELKRCGEAAAFAALATVQPDLIVCAGYMRIISADVLTPWVGRMINIHPSLLPNYPGLHTHRRVLAAGDVESGASVHFVIPELDAGPVLAQARVPVLPGDDETALAARVLSREHPLLRASVALLASGRVAWRDGRIELDGQVLAQPLQLDAQGRLQPAAA